MEVSPLRRCLYRTAGGAVIWLLFAAGVAAPQGAKPAVSKGLRALGLLELAPNGKAHLIPIAILAEGQFYDASAYKASPVPMALESGTVYEATRTGVSQGLFTVSAAGHRKDAWIGEGTWEAAGSKLAAKPPVENKPKVDTDEPPRLRRPGQDKPKPAEPAPPAANPPASAPSPAPPAPPAASAPPPTPPPAPPVEDQDRPVLRRGKPAPVPEKEGAETRAAVAAKPAQVKATVSGSANNGIQFIPAISDADGPEPRPYTYDLKAGEQAQFQEKILALAADEVSAQIKRLSPALPESAASKAPASTRRKLAQPAQPAFGNIQLRVLDLSNSNEPTLVLSADARMPQPSAGPSSEPYFVTFIAREDIYGDLHKAFAQVTDAQHQDVLPRLQFIDAVDADGDGRGELLFRRIYDAGSAFAVYRVIGDQLWPLFEGTPSQ